MIDGNRWVETGSPLVEFLGSNVSSAMIQRGVMAPGMDVLSTFYFPFDYYPFIRCADSGPDTLGPLGNGYGVCTGTSMAAPHVSGVLGLMRSANPQLTAADITGRLRATASNALSPNGSIGSGIVDATAATLNVLNDVGFNRLTPLYSFRLNYGSNTFAHFYTTVPQMGAAAVLGTLLPYNNFAGNGIPFTPIGTAVTGIPGFPGTAIPTARTAQAWIFTTHKNPHSATQELVPLYRLSYKCGDTLVSPNVAPAACGINSQYVSRTYATHIDNVTGFWKDRGYRLDGIEGYVYPNGAIQPPGTEALVLGQNVANGTYALYPESQVGAMLSLGFTTQNFLGRVFANAGIRPNIQFSVTATAGPNGTIAPSSQVVTSGASASITTTPTAGYVPLFNSFPCGGNTIGTSYATTAITEDCAVDATFVTTPGAPSITSIVPGNTVAFVNFSAGTNGGTQITGYTLTCNPGAIVVPGVVSPIKITGLTNGSTYTCGLAATNSVGTGVSAPLSIVPSASAPTVLGAVRSRKIHVGVGPFDLLLDSTAPVAGSVTVEPRKIDAGHTIVFQFSTPITTPGAVTASRGGTTWAAAAVASGTDVLVTLTGVADNNRVTVTLTNVNGVAGTYATSMGFLIGDVNNTRSVNSSDISAVKASSGQTTNAINFLRDLNSSGAVNSSDISAVKAQSGLTLIN
ncbi:MAG: S8 family serine peptidase [Usitatibacteraceae bacterium]